MMRGLHPLQALLCAAAGAAGTSLLFLSLNTAKKKRTAEADPRHHRLTPARIDGGRATLAVPHAHWRRFDGDSKFSRPGGAYVWRLVLTGGPCGGRSSAIRHLSRELRRRGVDVYAVPEAPTTLINGGCRPPPVFGRRAEDDDGAAAQLAAFETGLLQLQLQLERSFVKIAQATGRPAVVVMDRGLMDVAAYLPQDGGQWRDILREMGMDEAYLLGRYDMVLHLKTAADGAERHFPDERLYGDTAVAVSAASPRDALLARAREIDARVSRAWERHPNRHVVDNAEPGFESKLGAVLRHVASLVVPPGHAGTL